MVLITFYLLLSTNLPLPRLESFVKYSFVNNMYHSGVNI
jgi:hypothetical protein